MISRTKYEVDNETIIKLFDNAKIKGAKNIAPLGAGEFNSVYSVEAEGKLYAIKIAPVNSEHILTYEQDMMRQEVYYYELMREKAKINVPEVYFSDFSNSIIPAAYFIMDRIDGKQLNKTDLTKEEKAAADKILTEMVAKMHSVKGEKFGYRQNGLYDNWYLALRAVVNNLIEDCKKLGKNTERGKKLLSYIDRNKAVLEAVESSLINFDITPLNIICKKENGEIKLFWIDPERCFWGDRIADFVCLDMMNLSLDKKQNTIKAYNEASEKPILISDGERIRYAVMLGYLGLIMDVEKYARYSHKNFGFWRNVIACHFFYKASFAQLKALTKNE